MRIDLEDTVTLLQHGNIVAIPTETVYGLAAWIEKPEAVEAIFRKKNRPRSNPFIFHIAESCEVKRFATALPPHFEALANAFWPGPLTIIVSVREGSLPNIATAGLTTAAFRIPRHAETLKLLKRVSPLVAPSANLSGKPSSTKREHVERDFGSDFPVLDGGECLHGVESTIIAYVDSCWKIVRQGAITDKELASVLGYVPEIESKTSSKPICPGQHFLHYAPKAKLILSKLSYASCPNKQPFVIGFSDRSYPGAKKVWHLGAQDAPETASFRLYDILRSLDIEDVSVAWIDVNVPNEGLWKTILERLGRAASSKTDTGES
jgi:L-threonylcarbamoyladenylate synthase